MSIERPSKVSLKPRVLAVGSAAENSAFTTGAFQTMLPSGNVTQAKSAWDPIDIV